jgi:hypothetical protein
MEAHGEKNSAGRIRVARALSEAAPFLWAAIGIGAVYLALTVLDLLMYPR